MKRRAEKRRLCGLTDKILEERRKKRREEKRMNEKRRRAREVAGRDWPYELRSKQDESPSPFFELDDQGNIAIMTKPTSTAPLSCPQSPDRVEAQTNSTSPEPLGAQREYPGQSPEPYEHGYWATGYGEPDWFDKGELAFCSTNATQGLLTTGKRTPCTNSMGLRILMTKTLLKNLRTLDKIVLRGRDG